MNSIFPSWYEKFKCIADKCPNHCYKDWKIEIDEASLEKYSGLRRIFPFLFLSGGSTADFCFRERLKARWSKNGFTFSIEDIMDLMSRFSRQTEHEDENLNLVETRENASEPMKSEAFLCLYNGKELL